MREGMGFGLVLLITAAATTWAMLSRDWVVGALGAGMGVSHMVAFGVGHATRYRFERPSANQDG